MVCSIGSQANELELCIYLGFPENIQAYQWFIWGWGRGGGDKGEHSSPPLKFISLPLKTYTILVSRHTDLLQQVYFDKTKNKKKTKKKTHTTVQVTICCSKNDVTPNYVLATHRMGCNTFHQLFMGFSTYFMYVGVHTSMLYCQSNQSSLYLPNQVKDECIHPKQCNLQDNCIDI